MRTDELPPNWEAVVAEDGRTYYWNVDTGETSWVVPTVTTATSSIAASYVSNAQKSGHSSVGGAARELEELRNSSRNPVAELTRKMASTSTGDAYPIASPVSSPVSSPKPVLCDLPGKSKALSVESMRKYREAKEATALKEASATGAAARVGGPASPPPKVDLFK